MSHYALLVLGENIEEQLAPFDENKEVPVYVKATREQLIHESREHYKKYNENTYAKYLADPVAYALDCKNPSHLNYLENEFPKKLLFTEEEIYQEVLAGLEPEEIGAHGEQLSTYNPLSKWDWWVVGGRWENRLIKKDGTGVNSTTLDELDLEQYSTFAIIKNGIWYQRGEMGWWGFVSDEKEQELWKDQWKSLLADVEPNTLVTIIDCHI